MIYFIKFLIRTIEGARLELERFMVGEGLETEKLTAAREHLCEAEKALRAIAEVL